MGHRFLANPDRTNYDSKGKEYSISHQNSKPNLHCIAFIALKNPLTLAKIKNMPTLFTKIINGEIPAHKIAENDDFLAFLDINPNAKGHTLCIPKKEVNKIFDLDEKTYLSLMKFSKQVAHALEKTIACKRVGMAVVGLEVPHVHVHLIPLNDMKEMTFQHKVEMNQEELGDLAQEIASNVELS